jgi:integrase
MPRTQRPPAYRLHKARNFAVVTIDGRNHYLGPFGSLKSHEKYAQMISEWRIHSRDRSPATGPGRAASTLSINELILAYFRHTQAYFVKDGRSTGEQDNIRQALRFLRQSFGMTPTSEFGPLALKVVRQSMIDAGRSRRLINQDVHRIREMFRWAAAEKLYPGESLAALAAVSALEKGRTEAKEPPPIRPVDEAAVLATLPHLSPQVAEMVRFQLLTAARPGETCSIRPLDVDRSRSPWVYRPESHKTEHHGRERVIGPRAQEVLAPWLERGPEVHCFYPAEVVAERGTPDRGHAARPKADGKYTRHSYRVAIARACDRAFPHPRQVKKRGVAPTDDRAAELSA